MFSAWQSENEDYKRNILHAFISIAIFGVVNSEVSLRDILYELSKSALLLLFLKITWSVYFSKDTKTSKEYLEKSQLIEKQVDEEIVDELVYGKKRLESLESDLASKKHAHTIRQLYLQRTQDTNIQNLNTPFDIDNISSNTDLIIGYINKPLIFGGSILINSLDYPIFATIKFREKIEYLKKATDIIGKSYGVSVNAFYNPINSNKTNSINCTAEISISNKLLQQEFGLTSKQISKFCIKQLWQSPNLNYNQNFISNEIIHEFYEIFNLDVTKSSETFKAQTIAAHECSEVESENKLIKFKCTDLQLKLTCTIPNLRLRTEDERPKMSHIETLYKLNKCENIRGMPSKMNLHLAKVLSGLVLAGELSILLQTSDK